MFLSYSYSIISIIIVFRWLRKTADLFFLLIPFIIYLSFIFYTAHLTVNKNGRNLVERKNIESAINAALVHPFTNTALIICNSIHIFHLYLNSVCWSYINNTFDIFYFQRFFFLSNLYHSKKSYDNRISFSWNKNTSQFYLIMCWDALTYIIQPRFIESYYPCRQICQFLYKLGLKKMRLKKNDINLKICL
jgi:hypothetical protein